MYSSKKNILDNTITNTNINVNMNDYQEKINALNDQLDPLLQDYNKYYVFSKKNPEYSEYQIIFSNKESQIKQLFNNLLNTTQNVSSNMEDINKKIIWVNAELIKERRKNKEMQRHLKQSLDKKNGSITLIDDYKENYRRYFFQNYIYLQGVIMMGIVITYIMRMGEKK
jgi:hypothetical protein